MFVCILGDLFIEFSILDFTEGVSRFSVFVGSVEEKDSVCYVHVSVMVSQMHFGLREVQVVIKVIIIFFII